MATQLSAIANREKGKRVLQSQRALRGPPRSVPGFSFAKPVQQILKYQLNTLNLISSLIAPVNGRTELTMPNHYRCSEHLIKIRFLIASKLANLNSLRNIG